jgi:hypothetical protein
MMSMIMNDDDDDDDDDDDEGGTVLHSFLRRKPHCPKKHF